ncbi:MAG: class I SAM-dependent methyltransferase [Mycobacterium sp.]|nr:class I SAM-dependent methyltransferase [Mycobacterium sp.]
MTRRLMGRAVAKGEIALPAVPGMIDHYVSMCDDLFTSMGVRYSGEDLAKLREVLAVQLDAAYKVSPRSEIVITYESPNGLTASYFVKGRWFTVEAAYNNWVETREPPLFGTDPDARVWALAEQSGDPGQCPVLDIGAGTGRNSLALARRGHPVDSVEMTSRFAEILTEEAGRDSLNVRVLQRNVFDVGAEDLRDDYRIILLSEVVSDFRDTDQLRGVFELAARCLAPGGHLIFNVFLYRPGHVVDDAARQLGQQCYTTIFTRDELAAAQDGLPLELVADDSVYDYEKSHIPAEKWPPTSWYAAWVSGQDVFDMPREECPIEMRWLVYRKAG